MTANDDLLNAIFDGRDPTLRDELAAWMAESRRYVVFARDYRDKIRAKLRNARGADGMGDLRAELATAAYLLREPRFTLEYEKFAAAKQRSPDFTVTFKTHTPFNVEVRRLREADPDGGESDDHINKLMAVAVDKVGQMPAGSINLLWLVGEEAPDEADIVQAAANLRQLAERKDEEYFTRRGFGSAVDFLRHFGRLSAIAAQGRGSGFLWLNPPARHKVPADIALAVRRLVEDERAAS